MDIRTMTARPIRFVLCSLLLGVLQFSFHAFAQTTTGSIYGVVTDVNGAVIPNATVVTTNTDTNFKHRAVSNGSGEYVFPALDPGNYTVSTTVQGFKAEVENGIVLSSNQNIHVNLTLVAGAADQTVTVAADTTLVDTREAQLAETVDQRRIQELPLDGRDVHDLVVLVPGVTNYSNDTPTGTRVGANFSVNGLPTNAVSSYLDGTSDTAFYQNGSDALPNPDALQEFRLLTSNFDAEFGRSPGAVLNVITRSGTHDFHGMVYEYHRNNIFNAAGYFNTTGVTPLKRNQFGANLGGPMLRNDRAHFFLSYEHTMIHTPARVNAGAITTATALERTGDFSQSTSKPTTLPAGTNCGTPTAPKICSTALDPVAQNLLTFVPVEANGTSPAQNATGNVSNDEGLARVDYNLGASHALEALFFTSHGLTLAPTIGPNRILSYSGMSEYENQDNAVIVDTWTISPRTLNNLRPFYTQNRYIIGDLYPSHLLPSLGSLAPEGSVISAPPDFAITGYWTMGTSSNGPSDISQLSMGIVDTANLTRGHHEIKIGGSFIRSKYAETGGLQSNGIFTFSGGTSGNALADFLLGKANTLVQTTATIHRSNNYDPALFAQDDWQLTKRLNLNLGLRWEVYAPFKGDPNLGTFSPGVQSAVFPTAPLGLLYQGDTNVPQGVWHTSYKRFAPRFGFAYDVRGDGRTSLRGGYGIFYFMAQETYSANLQQQPYNLSVTTNKTSNLVCPYGGTVPPCPTGTTAGTDPFPFSFNPGSPRFVAGATVTAAPLNGATPYVMEYNLTVQQQLSREWGLSIGYVGNAARQITFSAGHDINAPAYAPGALTTTAGINARRPFEPAPGQYGAINLLDQADNFNYNSLQTSVHGHVGKQLDVQAFYVWSKAMSYEPPFVQGNNVKLNRGPATTNIANNFAASFLYSFPTVHLWHAFGEEVLSGWQLNDIITWHGGAPFTVISGTDTNLDGVVNDRADIVGNRYTNVKSHAQQVYSFLNVNAFANAANVYGNEQNDSMVGPRYFNMNASVFKTFPLYKELHLLFRAEAFNALNNVNFANPTANWITLKQEAAAGQTTAGYQIGSITGSPRAMQFALKLIF